MKICFVADDYGESLETNEAISRVCAGNVVRSVTSIASESYSYSDLSFKFNKDIAWGVHLYLTGYIPLTDKLKNLTKERKGKNKWDIIFGLMLGKVAGIDIYTEFDAQLSRLCQFGYKPQFIDTHQNIHSLPYIFKIVKQVAKKYGIEDYIRPFAQINFDLKKTKRSVLSEFYSNIKNFRRKSRFLINCPGYYKKTINITESLAAWDRFLSLVKGKDYNEIFVPCHPGISPAEVELYSSHRFFELLREHEIEITKANSRK